MTRVRKQAWAGAFAAVLSGVAAAGCGAGSDAQGAVAAGEGMASERVVTVEAVTVEREPFHDRISVTGRISADREVEVTSEEAGVIREVYVERGRRVSAGTPIAKIDDEVIRAQHDQAQAEATLAGETWERQRRLWEEDSIGSELAYLRAKYGAETAAANARALAARLARTVVRAPIGGILDDRYVEVGATVAPGSRVGRIIDNDPLSVEAGVAERYAGEIDVGSTAVISLDNGREVEGQVSFVGTAIDEDSRTFTVEVRITSRESSLKPGMVARIQLDRGELEEAILVPRDAVLRSASGYIVYVVANEGGQSVAEARTVVTGVGEAGRVVIEQGLEPGERVIVVGQQQVTAGDRLEVSAAGAGGGQ